MKFLIFFLLISIVNTKIVKFKKFIQNGKNSTSEVSLGDPKPQVVANGEEILASTELSVIPTTPQTATNAIEQHETSPGFFENVFSIFIENPIVQLILAPFNSVISIIAVIAIYYAFTGMFPTPPIFNG
jgi:hypothetical protein